MVILTLAALSLWFWFFLTEHNNRKQRVAGLHPCPGPGITPRRGSALEETVSSLPLEEQPNNTFSFF